MTNIIERRVKLSAREFLLPLIRDVLILGINAPIGEIAMGKSLKYLHAHDFDSIPIEDNIIGTIFIRSNLLLKIDREKLIEFLIKTAKSMMKDSEILQIDVDLEMIIESTL